MALQAPLPVSERLAGFAQLLREHGFVVGPAEQQALLRATLALGGLHPDRLSAAWRSIVCGQAREWRLWPELFERYWLPHRVKGQVRSTGATRPRRDLHSAVTDLHNQLAGQDRPEARPGAGASADQAGVDTGGTDAGSPRAMGGASQVEPLDDRRHQQWMPQDLAELQQLAARIARRLRPHPTRRWRADPHGQRLDLRRTLRRSVAHGGLPLAPAWRSRREQPPRLFLLVDVSRSMEAHAAFFLRVARAFVQQADARAFVFHTRLAEVTELLARDTPTVQEKINAVTAGFGAGTRIAANLQAFARQHARAQLNRHSRLWVLSDGYDTDAPEHLQEALLALRRHGARITWFHPTRTAPASQALRRAQRSVEAFVPLAGLPDLRRAEFLLT